MKSCPSCRRTYADDSLKFCLEDGSALVSENADASDLAATLIMPNARATSPARPETFRPQPPQAYAAPPPTAWPPVAATPQMLPPSSARQGRGAAITSLICAIAAFLSLGFCILGGATGMDESLIGGIFVFSALLALLGAVLAIVATVRTGKTTNAQNSRAMAIVSLVLNCIYLLITVIFLVLGAIASSKGG